ncbi:28S ribosomal protein S29: mitochondrial-like protein [Dinothrombium tinctorium]|uniref:Small ribosomal subunit protein mS29 n=1 Tax=Dinothrombium tinctorium TaxID=1965070 RepID=A0A443QVE1_9ACAR|nr:28S ribosomal protein S29: mitochondrial-like protein [Dinothrombium tinctorium]
MKHVGVDHIDSQYFVLPKSANDALFKLSGWRQNHKQMFEMFEETAIMVRKPFHDLLNYLSRTDFERPVNRYVLYGEFGNGKTFTLNHFLYHCFLNRFLIVHCSSPYEWVFTPQETAQSEWKSGRIDTPVEATIALKTFKDQNAALLSELDLRTSKKYTWSLRETTEEGEPLLNLIDYGLNRMKKASDCYAVLLKEIKHWANEGKIKVSVIGDVVNVLYLGESKVLNPDKTTAEMDNITIARAFTKMLRNDWKNGLVVVAVDSSDSFRDKVGRLTGERFGPDLPKYLLTEKGFQDLDPFIPIKVDKYTENEFENCLDYYIRKNYVNHPAAKTEMGRKEIKFMSAYNPLEVYKFCWLL